MHTTWLRSFIFHLCSYKMSCVSRNTLIYFQSITSSLYREACSCICSGVGALPVMNCLLFYAMSYHCVSRNISWCVHTHSICSLELIQTEYKNTLKKKIERYFYFDALTKKNIFLHYCKSWHFYLWSKMRRLFQIKVIK